MDIANIISVSIALGFLCYLLPYVITRAILKAINDGGGINIKFNHSDLTVYRYNINKTSAGVSEPKKNNDQLIT